MLKGLQQLCSKYAQTYAQNMLTLAKGCRGWWIKNYSPRLTQWEENILKDQITICILLISDDAPFDGWGCQKF